MPKTIIPRFAKRAALVEATLDSLGELGPSGVHPADICEELGLSKALVNYHFGSRDGLVAEAMALGYERYVDLLEHAVGAAGTDAFERLMAFYETQVDWTINHAGLAAALNFPSTAAGLGVDVDPVIQQRLSSSGNRNFSNLVGLVGAARRSFGHDDDPSYVAALAAMIGWSCLGTSVWFAGGHAPTRDIGLRPRPDVALAFTRTLLRRLLAA